MKSLRRSLNNNGNNASSPQPSPDLPSSSSYNNNPLARPSDRVAPPQKVIKALSSSQSSNPQQLSYTKGDFWYVTGEREGWYEALNPLTGSRGLVPKDQFEEFVKGGRQTSSSGSRQSVSSAERSNTPPQRSQSNTSVPMTNQISPPIPINTNPAPRKAQPLYAIVQYDFHAERPDELDARAGEPIVVIAQSNHEWFVAKPIGRLGGPGLIPVAFVEIRDPATGKPLENFPANIPQVDEWKKATADYKAAAIPLGRFDMSPDQAVMNSPYAPQQPNSSNPSIPRSTSGSSIQGPPSQSTPQSLPTSRSTSQQTPQTPAAVYRPEQDAMLPPGDFTSLGVPSFHKESDNYWFRLHATYIPQDMNSPAFTLSLYRTYEDFYDFQISLLDAFPYEAGRSRAGEEDQSPPQRIMPYMPGPVDDEIDDELTEYRREELDTYVNALLDLRTRKASHVLRHELMRTFFAARYGDYCEDWSRDDATAELEERLAEIQVGEDENAAKEEVAYNGRSESSASRRSQSNQSPQNWTTTTAQSSSRGPSPLPPIDTRSRPESSNYSNGIGGGRQSSTGHYSNQPTTAMTSSSWGSSSNLNQQAPLPPPVRQSNPPYIKIKIYDRATDDLIAIRVHPSVSHAELFEKVRARLGNEISSLRYRTSMSQAQPQYRELRDEQDLKVWLGAEDQKLVLYAEQG
ncbi:bud emergence protein 1, partial [Tremellales sp. Uapishka_1]